MVSSCDLKLGTGLTCDPFQESATPSASDILSSKTGTIPLGPETESNLIPLTSSTEILLPSSITSATQLTSNLPTISTTSASIASETATAIPVSTTFHSNGVSSGAVAGIAIGTALAGALIAFLITFLLFRRRQSRYQDSAVYSKAPVEMLDAAPAPKAFTDTVVAPARRQDLDLTDMSHSSDFLAAVLPQTADDRTVREKVSVLFDQVQMHVENFYRDVHASVTPSMESDLAKFGVDSVLPESVMGLFRSSSRPTVLIKHCLMGYVLGITAGEGSSGQGESLLPEDVRGVVRGDSGSRPSDLSPAFMIWKRLTIHLYNSSSSSTSSTRARNSAIREAVEHFSLTFFPWANPRYSDGEKDMHLVQVISNALDLSIWLLGQPFVYEYNWEGGVAARGQVVVAPGLRKVTDSKGVVVGRPQVLLEPIAAPA